MPTTSLRPHAARSILSATQVPEKPMPVASTSRDRRFLLANSDVDAAGRCITLSPRKQKPGERELAGIEADCQPYPIPYRPGKEARNVAATIW
jgi:hypothetical protein